MNNDNEIKQWFDAHRVDFPDNGFTRQLKHRLPARTPCLPLLLLLAVLAVATAFMTVASAHGFELLAANINELAASLGRLQPPSFASAVAFLAMPACIILTGYAIATTE
jgi:hypothetical protein